MLKNLILITAMWSIVFQTGCKTMQTQNSAIKNTDYPAQGVSLATLNEQEGFVKIDTKSQSVIGQAQDLFASIFSDQHIKVWSYNGGEKEPIEDFRTHSLNSQETLLVGLSEKSQTLLALKIVESKYSGTYNFVMSEVDTKNVKRKLHGTSFTLDPQSRSAQGISHELRLVGEKFNSMLAKYLKKEISLKLAETQTRIEKEEERYREVYRHIEQATKMAILGLVLAVICLTFVVLAVIELGSVKVVRGTDLVWKGMVRGFGQAGFWGLCLGIAIIVSAGIYFANNKIKSKWSKGRLEKLQKEAIQLNLRSI